jgi:hypothetical protein
MTMTIRQILAKTPNDRKIRANYVKITELKRKANRDGSTLFLAKSHSFKDNEGNTKRVKGNTYVTQIRAMGKSVIVGCTCDDFWATWEVALHKQGAAPIKYSNGEEPNTRNPLNIPGACKHVCAMANMLIRKGYL